MRHQTTVRSLIQKLSDYPPETLVVVPGGDHSYRIAYVADALAERDGMYIGEASFGDEKAFTVVVIE